MMRIAIFFIAALFLLPQATQAAEAFVNAKVNLRAGPDGGYPVVDILKHGERVELLGCISGYQWCEVETRSGEHGWVYAHYLDTQQMTSSGQSLTIIQTGGNSIRIISFSPRNYWNRYYRTKYFYAERDRWLPRDRDHDHHYHHNDDDRPHAKPRPRPRPQPKPEEAEPLKYQPIPMPSRSKYDPLCPIGQKKC